MKSTKAIIKVAAGDSGSHSSRMEALDMISDKSVLRYLAEKAADDWIRLESAIRGKVSDVLISLKNHPDERISLEASIELNDQERLTEIVLLSNDKPLIDIAINYLEDDTLLEKIINTSVSEKVRVMAALRLGDISVNRKLLEELTDENLKLKIAHYLNDESAMSELFKNSEDERVKKIAGDWLKGYNADS